MNNPDFKVSLMEQLNGVEKPEEMAQVFTNWANDLQDKVIKEANQASAMNLDSVALAQRGVRQLTTDEKKYYEAFIEAANGDNFKMALAQLDVVMPKTIIDAVFDDLTREHPILDWIDFQNTEGAIEFIYNADGVELATWSPLCAKIVTELSSSFKKVNLGLNKLSAFLPVCKAMLDLGPEWLDKYVRIVLSEAIAEGLEKAVIDGDGNNAPIGMTRNVADDVSVSGGVYPKKSKIKVKNLDVATYGTLLAKISKTDDEHKRSRVVGTVALIVNPVDYYSKVMPATTFQSSSGVYVRDVFPYPTEVIQSPYVAQGEAIMAMKGRYFFGLGTGKSGKIEFSDEYHFLEDERVYATKLYGNGKPKDNNAYQLLDITGLKPTYPTINTITNPTA